MTYSPEVERRLRELDAKGPYGRSLFNHYVRCIAKADTPSTNAAPSVLNDDELLEGYESAQADYSRYSHPGIAPYGTSSLSEWNYAIAALAAERIGLLRDEIRRRMKR